MKTPEIKQLLERYYEGISTIDEEQLLKRYFSGADVPEERSGEQEIFRYLSHESKTIIPEPSPDFEGRIVAAIERENKPLAMPERSRFYAFLSVAAAAVVILAAAYFFFERRPDIRDTYSDPEVAYAEAMKILYNVSERMNEGTKALDQLGALKEKTGKTLNAVGRSASLIEDNMKPLEAVFSTLGNPDKNKE